MAQNANIIRGVDGRQYIGLGNGCFLEVIGEQPNTAEFDVSSVDDTASEPLAPETVMTTGSGNDEVMCELRKVNARLDGIERRMDQFVCFAANMDKFMSTKPSLPANFQKRVEPEDFSDVRECCPILSEAALMQMEGKLKDKAYADKLFRFFHSEYNMNGKRDGKAFFKTIFRRLVAPPLLQPFSWKGNSRKKNGADPITPNRSFRNTFPYLIQFVQRVIAAADMEQTSEQTEMCFSQFLRQKRTEIQRYQENGGEQRAASSRSRKPKEALPCEEQKQHDMEQDSSTSQSSQVASEGDIASRVSEDSSSSVNVE